MLRQAGLYPVVVVVDRLTASFGVKAVGELVSQGEHAPAHPLSGFEHLDVPPRRSQVGGGHESREAGAHHHDPPAARRIGPRARGGGHRAPIAGARAEGKSGRSAREPTQERPSRQRQDADDT